MKEKEVLNIFNKTNALLEGHFKLSSGLHSGKYLQCALVLQHPEYAAKLGKAIALNFKNDNITIIAGPAIGGIIIAHEVARALNVRCVFGEREDGKMALRRGFYVNSDDKVLVVEDVITTGGSTKEVIKVINQNGARLIGVGAIVDRSCEDVAFGVKFKSLIKLDVKTFKPEDCPLCKKGIPVTKPGSRV